MVFQIHLRNTPNRRWLGVGLLCCPVLAGFSTASFAQAPAAQVQSVQDPAVAGQNVPAQTAIPGTVVKEAGSPADSLANKRHLRAAKDAYLAGAKKLEKNDLNGAEREFTRALKLDPENQDYAVAISVAREHRVTELAQQAGKARLAGDDARADNLLAKARAIDPDNPIVIQHSGALLLKSATESKTESKGSNVIASGAGVIAETNQLADRTQMLFGGAANAPWKIQAPSLAGAIQLAPSQAVKSFHLRGVTQELLRQVASSYGIRVFLDESVERKGLRFDLENVHYQQAMAALLQMGHVFAVPIDETSIMVAKDTADNRDRLQRQIEETIYLAGASELRINEMANVIRTIFAVRQATVQKSPGSIVVRAPEEVLAPMNRSLMDLIDSGGEIMLEVKLYEVDTTGSVSAGASIPTSAGIYNVEAAATDLVNANQTIVQQAISQGLIKSTDSNLLIAGELIASGLVQSSLFSSTIGAVGKGKTWTGITETGTVGFNLGLNSTSSQALDQVQMRVSDHEEATFREGTRYPIVSSTYSSGLSSTSSALAGKTINGVSVASLLAQYSSGTSATIPQVTYEDLGVTLKATPVILKSGRINLKLDLKIEALSGSTSDGNPILENRQFASNITIGEGESALLVSDVNRSEAAAMSGLPGLSELPGFQMPLTQTGQKSTTQLVVMVTPHVVRRRSNLVLSPRIAVRGIQ